MKKSIYYFLVLIAFSLLLTACSSKKSRYDYKLGQDGLIYNIHNNQLYTGTIIDTADVVIEFDVVKGVKNGAFLSYYMSGQVQKYGYVKNNLNQGEWNYFYPNGQKETVGNFINDKPEGEWTSYYKNGQIQSIGNYVHGKQQGVWRFYDSKGNLSNSEYYNNGLFVSCLVKNS